MLHGLDKIGVPYRPPVATATFQGHQPAQWCADKTLLKDPFTVEMCGPESYSILWSLTSSIPAIHRERTFKVLWDMRIFSAQLAKQFQQLPFDYDTSKEAWLAKTSYTQKEKEKFLSIAKNKGENIIDKDKRCASFIKAETYPEFKFPRPIKSRSDKYKAEVGPFFQGINECLFEQTKFFIKKVPVKDRPNWLKQILFPAEIFDCTDYSSFEAHFIACVIYAIEFPLYCWITDHCDQSRCFRNNISALLEINVCEFKDFIVECFSRASGEMNTSSGNGYANLCVFKYITTCKLASETKEQFEGDDGITKTIPASSRPTTEDYLTLGWTCKLESTPNFSHASFCGIVADPDELVNVCDIKNYIVDFGWTKHQYIDANYSTVLALIRAKGFSAIYQYPSCPIIDALGHYALRITNSDVVHRKMIKMINKGQTSDNRYKAEQQKVMLEAVTRKFPARLDSPPKTRHLVEEHFKIPVSKQLEVERYLDSLQTMKPLQIELDFPECWAYNNQTYVDILSMENNVPMQINNFNKFIQEICPGTVPVL